jgi:hypothetical protein
VVILGSQLSIYLLLSYGIQKTKRDKNHISVIIAIIWSVPKPLRLMAPDLHEATHRPQPLHSTGFICALPAKGPSSINDGAEYGHILTQMPQLLQNMGLVSATVPLVLTVFAERRVTALEDAAWAWATDSSTGLG